MENIGEDEVVEDVTKSGRKKLRNERRDAGEEYINIKGKVVPSKMFIARDCTCQLKCKDNVPDEIQKKIHERFYGLKSWDAQTAWLGSTVKIVVLK